MGFIVGFARFWYDFIVGDDWTVAAGVIVALVLAAVLTRVHLVAWWWLPAAVGLLLAASLWRAARATK
jgi:hypothetical protein